MDSSRSNWQRRHRALKREMQDEEFSGWTDREFIEHILTLREDIELLESKIEKLERKNREEISGQAENNTLIPEKEYNQNWTYPAKIVFILKWQNRPLTSMEIHDFLLKLDVKFPDFNNPKNKLSVYLNRIVKNGRIKAEKLPGVKELRYYENS